MANFYWMLLCAGSYSKNYIHINSFNHQNLGSLSATIIIPVLFMRTLRLENSNDLPKETYLVGGKGNTWNQAIWHHNQYFWPSHCVVSLEDNIIPRSVKIFHWKVTQIHGFASYIRVFTVRRIWSQELFWFFLTGLIFAVYT